MTEERDNPRLARDPGVPASRADALANVAKKQAAFSPKRSTAPSPRAGTIQAAVVEIQQADNPVATATRLFEELLKAGEPRRALLGLKSLALSVQVARGDHDAARLGGGR